MEVDNYIELHKINGFYGFLERDFRNYPVVLVDSSYEDIKVIDYFKDCNDKKINDSLKIVNLSNDILDKRINDLASSEKLRINLARLLIKNEEIIVFKEFDKYFMEKDLLYFKKLFKKLVKRYNKTLIFINSRTTFLLDLANILVIKDKSDIKVFNDLDFYKEDLSKYIELPEIVLFIKLVKSLGIEIEEYTDLKELIKGIYRVKI